MKSFVLLLATTLAVAGVSRAIAADWITSPSWFTHDPKTGHRTTQFAPTPPVYHQPPKGRSVYRQARSSLQIGDSIDQYHVVDEYGHPVRPYGEWRFPFRPFSVPYHLWGPTGGYGVGGGFGVYGGFGPVSGIGSPFGPYGAVNGAGFPPPWNDGSYPDVRRRQLPPQGFQFPSVNNTTNNINGNNNSPASNSNNNSPTTTIPGNNNNVIN